jgi:GntR family transcriptional repressor for pyruvate dehydrogenase complex
VFNRIQQVEKKTSFVVKQILSLIESGELNGQERFPNEIDIASAIGVSRSVIREAMSALEMMEVIERRPGDGTYLKSGANPVINLEMHRKLMGSLEEIETAEGSFDSFEARVIIEPSIAELAARRAQPEDIAELERIYRELESSCKSLDFERYHAFDKKFHIQLAKTTQNHALVRILEGLLEEIKIDYWNSDRIWPKEAELQKSLGEHARILETVRSGDSMAVSVELQRHFDTALNNMK